MSNRAMNWAFDSGLPPGPRFVLVVLADHAGDHKGEDWTCYPSMGRICRMTGQGERTVERHLVFLVENGWISRRRRPGRERDDGAYIYALHRARGEETPANLAGDGCSLGEATPAKLAGVQDGRSPANLAATTRQIGGDHPPNPTNPPDPPKEINPQGTPNERRGAAPDTDAERKAKPWFEVLKTAWAKISPGRTAPKPSWRAFLKAAQIWPPERICDAGLRYLQQDADVQKLGPYRLHAWLAEERFEPWLVAPDKAETRPNGWTGPPAIRTAVVQLRGEDFARSYLDPSTWSDGQILARTSVAARNLSALTIEGVHAIEVSR